MARGKENRGRERNRAEREESPYIERVVSISRVSKVVKGGRRFRFSALVVVGDGAGRVGIGLGKATEVPQAIRKGTDRAKKELVRISLEQGTIPHEVMGHYGSSHVLMKPASKGTGVIAGGAVRALVEVLGIKNILTKSIGTQNPHNVSKATLNGLKQLRSEEWIAKRRGKGNVSKGARNETTII